MPIVSGSKCPLAAISRAERISSAREKRSPGLNAQLAAYDFLVKLVVTVDDHFVDACLRTFDDAHLEAMLSP